VKLRRPSAAFCSNVKRVPLLDCAAAVITLTAMRMLVAVMLAFVAVACTPRAHRVYQTIVAVEAAAAFSYDYCQTSDALANNPSANEDNPFLGRHPSPLLRLWAPGVSVGAVAAVWKLPRGRPLADWWIDLLLTTIAVTETSVVYSNASIMKPNAMRCGH
jgi:hypothetical protein